MTVCRMLEVGRGKSRAEIAHRRKVCEVRDGVLAVHLVRGREELVREVLLLVLVVRRILGGPVRATVSFPPHLSEIEP